MAKDPKVEGINKLDGILGNKRKFRRLIILVIVLTPLVVGSIMAWKGCEWHGKNSHIKVKSTKVTQ